MCTWSPSVKSKRDWKAWRMKTCQHGQWQKEAASVLKWNFKLFPGKLTSIHMCHTKFSTPLTFLCCCSPRQWQQCYLLECWLSDTLVESVSDSVPHCSHYSKPALSPPFTHGCFSSALSVFLQLTILTAPESRQGQHLPGSYQWLQSLGLHRCNKVPIGALSSYFSTDFVDVTLASFLFCSFSHQISVSSYSDISPSSGQYADIFLIHHLT